MAFLRIGYQNLLANPDLVIYPGNTATGIYTELVYPKEYLRHPHHKPGVMPWRSVYQTIVVTDGNNKIYFNDGSDRVVTIDGTNASPRQYRMANYLAECQSKLNASPSARTFTCSQFDMGGGILGVQLVADAAVTWQLNSTTGAFINTIWSTIGVDCSPGTQFQTSMFTSIWAQPAGVKSTYGRQIIKASNDGMVVKLGAGSDVSFALTNGAGNCMTVADLLRVVVCDQLNITAFDAQWDASVKKFKWLNATGSDIILRATQAGFQAADLLGITPGVDFTIATGAGYVVADSVRKHTSEEIVIVPAWGAMEAISLWSNAGANATVRIQANDTNLGSETDDDWTGATFDETLAYNAATPTFRLAGTPASVFVSDNYASAPNQPYFRVEIEDKANTADEFVEIDAIFAGEYEELGCHPSQGQQYGGETFTEKRIVLQRTTFGLEYLSVADWQKLQAIADYCQNLTDYPEGAIPALWMMNLESGQYAKSLWALLKSRPEGAETDAVGDLIGTSITLVESK